MALIYPSARVQEQMSQILAHVIGVRAIFGVPRASILDFFWFRSYVFLPGCCFLDVLLGGLISAHCLTVFWTSSSAFVLGLLQGIALDALVRTVDEPMLRRERIDMVRQAIRTLTDEHRSILVLREMQEHSYEDIAEILEISIGTVRSRLSRARRQLKTTLESMQRAEEPS